MKFPGQMATRILAQSYRFVPTNLVSRAWGRLSRTAASRSLILPFARTFGVAVGEAEMAPGDYPTLNAFFTRRLKPGSRPIDPDPAAVISPVDGQVSASGVCAQDRMLQVKGTWFDLFGLLRDAGMSRRFENGAYATLYLSPRDYHRIHAPVDMTIHTIGYMPGTLLPVNPPSVRWIPGLYTQNERVMLYADSPAGPLAMVLVGAHCVGSITLTFHDFVTNRPGTGPARMNLERPARVDKGEEVGSFEMGSTVVVLFTPGAVELDLPPAGEVLRLGQRIATTRGADDEDTA